MKVYGPYGRADGRLHVIKVDEDGGRVTQSYPRYLMEQHLQTPIPEGMTVDHINNDKHDNRIESLQLLTLSENVKKARELQPISYTTFNCSVCGAEASRMSKVIKYNQSLGMRGPFCCKSCAAHDLHQSRRQA